MTLQSDQRAELLAGHLETIEGMIGSPHHNAYAGVERLEHFCQYVLGDLQAAGLLDEASSWAEFLETANFDADDPQMLMYFHGARDRLRSFAGTSQQSPLEPLISLELLEGAHGVVKSVARQVNICFENKCYDACMVMLRRLIELLIIDLYERSELPSEIQSESGDYLMFSALIKKLTGSDSPFVLDRPSKKHFPKLAKLKDYLHQAAHNRNVAIRRNDIEQYRETIRFSVETLNSMTERGPDPLRLRRSNESESNVPPSGLSAWKKVSRFALGVRNLLTG